MPKQNTAPKYMILPPDRYGIRLIKAVGNVDQSYYDSLGEHRPDIKHIINAPSLHMRNLLEHGAVPFRGDPPKCGYIKVQIPYEQVITEIVDIALVATVGEKALPESLRDAPDAIKDEIELSMHRLLTEKRNYTWQHSQSYSDAQVKRNNLTVTVDSNGREVKPNIALSIWDKLIVKLYKKLFNSTKHN